MARKLTVTGVNTTDGKLELSFSRGTDPQVFSYFYPNKLAAKALLQELDDTLEQALLLILVALYARQSGDTNLANADALIGHTVTLDLTKVTSAITFS